MQHCTKCGSESKTPGDHACSDSVSFPDRFEPYDVGQVDYPEEFIEECQDVGHVFAVPSQTGGTMIAGGDRDEMSRVDAFYEGWQAAMRVRDRKAESDADHESRIMNQERQT